MQAVYLTFGLQHQLGHCFRTFAWLGIWFALADTPLMWDEQSYSWNAQAGTTIWRPKFSSAHSTIWRCILVYALFNVCGLLSAAAGKALSLQFHEANHFEKMQVRASSGLTV